MIIYEILFVLITLATLNVFLFYSKSVSMYWSIFSNLVYGLLIISYFTIRYSNLTNFFFITVILGLIGALFLKSGINLNQIQETYREGTFLFWFMLILTIITLLGIIRSFNYAIKLLYMEAPIGDKGYSGPKGDDGETLDSDLNMCYNQGVELVEKKIRKYKDDNNIEYDPKLLQFKNLYFKRQIKNICNSDYYKKLKKMYGSHYGPVKEMNNGLEKMINHLLTYKNGLRFLENEFYVKYQMENQLMTPGESVSPFVMIEKNEVWKWVNK